MELTNKRERLMELVGLLRDGRLDGVHTTELESILENDPEALAYYVESIDMIATLHRQQGLVVDDQADDRRDSDTGNVGLPSTMLTPDKSARRSWWSVAGWSGAICASLVIGILAGRTLLWSNDTSAREAIATKLANKDEAREIATLSSASNCVWDPRDESRYEGQRLTAGTLRLVEGVAMVHFDCDVNLVLEGPAHLDLASFDRAILLHGKVVFNGDDDMDRFTLETPFSKIQDEGTEYAVSVDPSGEIGEIHVFDGRVICDPIGRQPVGTSEQSIRLDAGEARRFEGPNLIETIELASTRFIREPVIQAAATESTLASESFEYELENMAGQNGGTGWQNPWVQASRFDSNQGAKLRPGKSLLWPGSDANGNAGSLLIEGDGGLNRTLQEPIRMDRDAAYYVSFLFLKNAVPQKSKSKGWAYITLRNSQDKTGHISIGPITQPDAPRIVHDGRVANATSPLREDVVYLFVCKILAGKNKDDQVQVRIYSDHEAVDSVEPSIWNITTRPVRTDSVLNELRVSAKNSPPIQFDELRIGKTWSSVTSEYMAR